MKYKYLLSFRVSNMKHLKLFVVTFLPLLIVLVAGSTIHKVSALNYTDRPMDDSTFRASFTMSPTDIQTFLQNKGSGLANFSDVENCGSSSGSHYSFYATYYSCGQVVSASKIIYDASQAYGINPQVVLATMQKEQSLITTPNPTASQLNYAMGYGCPDSGGCSYAGFFNQVDNGTWQFRTDYELSSGNNYWGYSPSSYPCQGPANHTWSSNPMVYYNYPLVPGSNVTFYDDYGNGYANFTIPNASTAALYCYTPHVFPGSSQEYYSGSYWFVYYFSAWFGNATTPYAFKSPSGTTVYMFVNGYKVAVPSMAMLQDYGVNPNAIQVLSQSTVDSIPTPSVSNNGISPVLSYLIKSPSDSDADGGTVYLVSEGSKNGIISPQQFTDFGFNSNNIAILPLSYINSISGSSPLSYYLQTPESLVFQVSGGQKRAIFDYPTFIAHDPSGAVTPASYTIVSGIASGTPLSNNPLLIRQAGSATVYLYTTNGNYYPFSSLDVYSCWGVSTTLALSFVQISDNSYIAPITPGATLNNCVVSEGTANYLLSKNMKYILPASYGNFSPQSLTADMVSILNALPVASSSLKQAIKAPNDPSIWYLENGGRKGIPSITDFNLLGLAGYDMVDSSSLSSIQNIGFKVGAGQVVKSTDNPTVYVATDSGRIAIVSSDDFLAYGYSWSSIESFPSSSLQQLYPATSGQVISKYLYDQPSGNIYLMDINGCYSLSSSQLTSYGQSQSSIISNQLYTSTLFPYIKLGSCRPASTFVKSPGQDTIYWVDSGQKYPISSWNKLVAKSGQSNPYIINLSPGTLSTLPSGATL